MPGSHPTLNGFASVEARDERILELHAEHNTLRDIGKQVGLSHERVRKIISEALRINRKAEVVAIIQAETEALADEAVSSLVQMARDRSNSTNARAICWGEARMWNESKRKCFGVDEPTRSQVSVVAQDVLVEEIQRLEAEMAAADKQLPSQAA